jgi:hypothetical protein
MIINKNPIQISKNGNQYRERSLAIIKDYQSKQSNNSNQSKQASQKAR